MNALIIINMQNDYCEGGVIAIPGSLNLISKINRIKEKFDIVIFTKDWHPHNHCTFINYGGSLNPYCVKDTDGAKIHSKININPNKDYIIYKETEENYQSNSAFYKNKNKNISNDSFKLPDNNIVMNNTDIESAQIIVKPNTYFDSICGEISNYFYKFKNYIYTHPKPIKKKINVNNEEVKEIHSNLEIILKNNNITDLYFCGLPFEYSVYESILDAYKLRYNIHVIDDVITGGNTVPIEKCKKFLKDLNIKFVTSDNLFI